MRRFADLTALLLVVVTIGGALSASAGNVAKPQPTSARTAELRVLGAPRLFWRWGGAARRLVDPTTRLIRTDTKATCRLQARTAASASFVCLVQHGEDARLRVRYVGYGSASFRIRRL